MKVSVCSCPCRESSISVWMSWSVKRASYCTEPRSDSSGIRASTMSCMPIRPIRLENQVARSASVSLRIGDSSSSSSA